MMSEDPAMQYLRIDPNELMKQQAKTFDAKKWVWVPVSDSDGYGAAMVKSASGDKVTVETEKGQTLEVKKEQCDQMNPPKYEKATDMANLTYLNEASVLYNLKSRYVAGLIYTYSGLFCIAVNPYRRLPIYTDSVVKMFRGKRRQEMPPHVFAIVDNAYQDMLIEHDNQSMLITGESGAGKTENTKKVIQYIAKVAGVEKKKGEAAKEEVVSAGGVAKIKGDLDEQVVQANPLLEAFGNAKTTRNNNSSRFGKFIRCHFSQTGKLAGADIESYLLEKNRVIHQGCAERNYHIFYQLLYATSDEDLAKYCLITRKSEEYEFLNKGVPSVDAIDDHEEFGMTEDAVKVLGFTQDEKESMFKICGAILNFGNMKFKQKPRDEQAEIQDPADGERVGYLLGIPVGEFHKSLIKPKVKVGTEYVNKGQSVKQVLYSVAALAKALFERMFFWIVDRINKALDTKERRSYFIGVLDIAGFEIFDYNSFEQLCINLTNEKLQQFFNHHMFVLEQEEYKKEGIHWEFIDFGMDLEMTIDLIEKPMGIFAMLEEECIVPKATDVTYLTKLHKQHAGTNKSYGKPTAKQAKAGGGDFILHHYAGSVGYSVAGWLEKNKDPINEHTAGLFSKATDPLVNSLFQDYNPDLTGGRRKGSAFQTVSFRHKESLKKLVDTLMSTSPHFVRCIIPNEEKKPGMIDGQLCLHQLRCNGVLEGIRICRKGFPSRMPFQDFRQRYQILAASAIPAGFIDGKVAAEKLVEALQLDQNEYRVGLTKVFFRAGIVGELEDMRDERLSKIISQFQAYCKGHLMRIEYKKMVDQRVGLAVIQRNVRKFLFLRNWSWWKLYIKVQPLLSIARAEDDMKEKEEELKKAQEKAKADAENVQQMAENLTATVAEKEKLFASLQAETNRLVETEDKLMQTQQLKDKLESSLNEALEKLDGEEHQVSSLSTKFHAAETKIEDLEAKGEELSSNISRLEGEKTNRDKQIVSLNSDIAGLDESIAKLGKEKKGVEENLQERTEQLQASEDKANGLNKAKKKVEETLADTERSLAKEKEAKAKVEKDKRKVEGELKATAEKLADTENELKTTQDTVVKKEKAIKELEDIKESQENQIKQLQRKIQELTTRIEELEEELENERKLRHKSEQQRKDLEASVEELNDQLELAGGATTQQVEVSKKREAECARLRKEIEELNAANDAAAAAAKGKANQANAEAQDEIENLKKAKAKSDKDKTGLSGEINELNGQIDTLKKQKAASDKNARTLDEQLSETRGKVQNLEDALVESEGKAGKLLAEAGSVSTQLADAEHKLGLASKANKSLEAALNDAKDTAEAEAKGKQDNYNKLQKALSEVDALNEQIEEEQSSKADVQKKLSNANSEIQQWKSKFDSEGANRTEELEDAKKKLAARVQEMEEALAAAESKASSMEKVKNRMNEEVEDLLIDLEKAQAQASNLEKKQKKVDQQINEWKMKCDEVQADLDKSQKDCRGYSTELLKVRTSNEDTIEKYDSLKKENRALTAELSGITEQLSEGGKSSHEVEKIKRKLGMENEELQIALEEAEAQLEQEEAKLLKFQLELTQLKQSSDRRLAEKDEEIESMRKNHARQFASLSNTIEADQKTKAEAMKIRKKHDGEMAEVEAKLEQSERNAGEYLKGIKKLQLQIKELQGMIDDEARGRDDMRDSAGRSERRANELAVQLDELRVALEQAERARMLAENEKQENADRVSELQAMYNNISNAKRKAEGDFHSLQEEIEELENEAKAAEDKAQRALGEVQRLMSEVNSAQESTSLAEKSRYLLSKQLTDLQSRLEEAEQNGGKGLKNQIRKLEGRIMELENDVDTEQRKSSEIIKLARKADKKVKELQFSMDDDHKAVERAQDAAEKLNQKMKKMRMQLEESEAQNATISSKHKKAVVDLEEAEERCDAAEVALQKARQRARSGASTAATRGASRAPSAPRTPRSRTAKAGED